MQKCRMRNGKKSWRRMDSQEYVISAWHLARRRYTARAGHRRTDVVLPYTALRTNPRITLNSLIVGMKSVAAAQPDSVVAAIQDLRPNGGFSVSYLPFQWAAGPDLEAVVLEDSPTQTMPLSNIFPVLASETGDPPPFPVYAWPLIVAKLIARHQRDRLHSDIRGPASYPETSWGHLFHTSNATVNGINTIGMFAGESARWFSPREGAGPRSLVDQALDASWPLMVGFNTPEWFAFSRKDGAVWAHTAAQSEPWENFEKVCPWDDVESIITLSRARTG
jgi:hypothetical protein